MSTTLANSRIALSKDLGDFWSGTTTGAGSASTVVDTALKAKANDWIHLQTWDLITSSPCQNEERKVSSLDNTTGTLTVLSHTGTGPGNGATYELHRLFSASDKRLALISAAKTSFPYLHKKIRDETKTVGNILLNGDMEKWTVSTVPDSWVRGGTITAAQITTAKLFTRSLSSCKLSASTNGYLYQSWTENDDLKLMRGKSVRFRARGWCDTASALRLAIYDGTTFTYSGYHDGDSAWNDRSTNDWYVEATVPYEATDVSVRVYLESGAVAYVDDLEVLYSDYNRVYVTDIGMALDKPMRISWQDWNTPKKEPWQPVRNYTVAGDGYIYLDDTVPEGSLLRFEGLGYLDYLLSGAASTDWTATIAVDDPQLRILTAEAALYLYQQMSLPNFTAGTRDAYAKAYQYWVGERDRRIGLFQMVRPPLLSAWGAR